MKNKKLIAFLSAFDPEIEVCIHDYGTLRPLNSISQRWESYSPSLNNYSEGKVLVLQSKDNSATTEISEE